jgi:NAD(P)-dependent dehydrogenase (short-subunit alcohol dehydrogenase family)
MRIAEKVVLITGAGSGIGRAMAVAFGREGARVICCGRRRPRLDETVCMVADQGGTAQALPVDVTQVKQVQAVVAAVVKEFGRVDILVNNAARFGALGAAWEVDLGQWKEDLAVNLIGPVQCCRAVLPYMIARKEGIIFNIAAQAGTAAKPGCSAYACSKAALIHLTNTLASELALKNLPIVVFGLDPGFNRTEMTQALGQMAEADVWLPGLKTAYESASGTEPERVAQTAVDLVRFGDPVLSGRTFKVGIKVEYIREHAGQIEKDDLLTLRFRQLP